MGSKVPAAIIGNQIKNDEACVLWRRTALRTRIARTSFSPSRSAALAGGLLAARPRKPLKS
jgi:hypothetical protein